MFSRDTNYRMTGGLPIASARGVRRHLGVDTAVIETPMTPKAAARLAPGCGVVLQRDGRQEFSGLVAGELKIGFDENSNPLIKAQLVGDNVHIEDRLVYPDHTRAGDQQTTFDYWTYNGPASSAIWELINEQVGPDARPERRLPALYMGADPGVGTSRPWRNQFVSVMTACAEISGLSTPNLGVRMTSTPDGLRADVYVPRDLSDQVRFSADLSNLEGFSYTQIPPSVTDAIVAGQGDLRARLRRTASTTNPLDLRWGRRIERYIDRRDESDQAQLTLYAQDAIAEGAGQVSLSCDLSDSQAARYGRDWNLGDRITVYVGLRAFTKAAIVRDIVRQVEFEVRADGAEKFRPAIGGTDASAQIPGPTQKTLAQIGRRLETLETRK